MTDLEVVRRLAAAVDTTAVCDADKRTRVMSPAIACRSAGPVMVGPAFTVRCRDDFFGVLCAIEDAEPGHVIVVDGGAAEVALAGELFARTALTRGLAGIVVDAAYRDITYVSTCPLPIFSRHVTPMAGTTNKPGELEIPITCGGVTVSPGDLIMADPEGIIVLDPTTAETVLTTATEIKAAESRVIAHLESGDGTLANYLNVTEHRRFLTEGKPSSLRFTV